MKCIWGFVGGLLLGTCAAIVIVIIAFIVANLFTIAPDEYLVFWLAVLGIPSLIVVGCTLMAIINARGNKPAQGSKVADLDSGDAKSGGEKSELGR